MATTSVIQAVDKYCSNRSNGKNTFSGIWRIVTGIMVVLSIEVSDSAVVVGAAPSKDVWCEETLLESTIAWV